MGWARTSVVVLGLLKAVSAGDTEKYTEVVNCCRPTLTAFVEESIKGFDAEAVVTETFLVAYKKIAEFEGSEDADFYKRLFAIARNKVREHWASERRAKTAYTTSEEGTGETDPPSRMTKRRC